MPSAEQTATRTFRRTISLIVLTLLLANLALFFVFRSYAAHRLNQVKHELAAAGHPVTIEELDRSYDPEPGAAERGQAIVRVLEKQNLWSIDEREPLLLSSCPAPESALDVPSLQAT